LHESILQNFSLIKVWLCNFFWRKNIGEKSARKMLTKLTAGRNILSLILVENLTLHGAVATETA
jgi:hypothetical protein